MDNAHRIFTTFSLLIIFHKATFTIWEPRELKNLYDDDKINYIIANFGRVPFGKSIYGTMIQATPIDACDKLDEVAWDSKRYGSMIVLVERGKCHFATKVKNAQEIGA